MTRGRRHAHRCDDPEHHQRQHRLRGHEPAQPSHRRPADGGRVAGEGREEAAIERRQHDHRDDEGQLDEQQPAVARAEQSRHAADLEPRVPDPGDHDHDEQPQRGRGEATGHEDGVRAGVGARFASGQAEQPRQRRQRTDPETGGHQVPDVGGDGRRRVGLDGRRVAGGGDQAEGREAEQGDLAARRAPVGAVAQIRAHGDERAQQEQQPAAHQPHRAGLRLQEQACQRRRLDRRRRAILEQRGLGGDGDERAGEGNGDQRAAAGDDPRLPAPRRRSIGRAGQEQRGRPAHEQDRRDEMKPARDERRHWLQSKLTWAPAPSPAAALGMSGMVGLPIATVIRFVVVGTVTSAP